MGLICSAVTNASKTDERKKSNQTVLYTALKAYLMNRCYNKTANSAKCAKVSPKMKENREEQLEK